MVKVDDATYVAMRDNLYKGDSAAASKAKAQIESSYTDEQYNNFVSKLGSLGTQKEATPTSVNNAPVEQPTQTETPTPVKQETEIKQAETVGSTVPEIQQQGELKPLSQEYYNQTSDDAQSKIISNLNNYRQTNPEYFRDYESFKKNFSYDARNDEQKQTLDSWYGGYQKGMELAGIPVTDLYTQYKDGQVSMNELENLRIYDPTKYAELQNQINKGNIIAAYDDDKGIDVTGMSIQDMAYQSAAQIFTKWMSGDTGSEATQYFRELEAKMESPEMMEIQDKTTELQEQIENLNDDRARIKKEVEKEYEGTGATRSKINAIIADRSYDLDLQLRTLNSEYNKYATQYNNRVQQYQNEFQLQLQEYQINQQARQQQMDELGFAIDLMNFETNDQRQQREWDYWVKQQEYTNGNINSSDYQTRYKAALKSVQNLLSQYEGIPMKRSAEQMAQDILKAIDGGSDLGTELTKINQQIQGKPEYKMLYNQTYRNPDAGFTESFTVGDTQYVKYNGQRYTADELNSKMGNGAVGNPKPYDVVSEEMFSIDPSKGGLGAFLMDSKNANGKYGGQCAKFVNNYLQQIGVGRYFGEEDIKTREQRANSDTPKVGTIAIFDYGVISKKTGKNHGHVAIVTQVNSDGSFVVKESNYPSGETIGTRTVKPGSTSLKGFFDPSKGAMSISVSDVDNGTNTSFVSGSIEGVPLAYERAVKNLVPAALQNSDKEREALDKIISNSYNGGIDQSEIALTYMGFDIKDESNKKLAMDLVNTVRTLSTDTQEGIVQTISDLMNQGAYTKAIQTVENAVSLQAKSAGNYIPENSVKNTMKRVNSLTEYINGLDSSPVGVVSGTMQDWLGRLSSKKSKEILNMIAAIDTTLDIKDAETRSRILPQLTDNPSVFMTKLNNLNTNMMGELNGWREIYGLPALTTEALNDYSKRVNLYKSNTANQSTKTVSGLNVIKSNLSNMSKNIIQSTPNTKATLQSKYGINN